MGLVYSKLKELRKPLTATLVHSSLSKIRDFHGAFKSICDTFAISSIEFEQIFGNVEAFPVWDTDKNGVIDALEMFTGLILFSEARAEDKLKTMFELFDFNEIRTISLTDLEFLLFCCVSAALKIYGYADEYPKDEAIHLIVKNSLTCTRVTLNNLLHFCAFSEEINNFIDFFKVKGLSLPKPTKKQDYYEVLRNNQYFPIKSQKIDTNVQKKIESSLKAWIAAVLNPISQHSIHTTDTGKFGLHWVLGINSENIKHNIGVVPGNEILVYFISSIVVILYCKILKQKHYLEHTEKISSICVGKDLACSGERGNNPKIHIWRVSTLETLQVLSGIHQTSVTQLGFTNNETHLVTCSTYTVVIYEWRSKNILVATNHVCPISDLYLLPRITSSSCFALACDEEITVYTIEKEKLNVATVSLESSMCSSNILSIAGQGIYDLQKEGNFLLLTGHADGSVLLWEGIEFQRLVVAYESSITAIQILVNWYAIGTSLGCIYLWDSKLDICEKTLELSMCMFKLMSFEISSMVYINKKLYISTSGGDVVEGKVTLGTLKIVPKRIDGIIQLPKGQNHVVFLSADLPFLVTSGESGVMMTVDLRSYEIIDTWAVGYSIHSLKCQRFKENIYFVAGCEQGHLFIRENWDVIFHPEAGSSTITDTEFISSGKFLAVTSEDNNIYIFKKGSSYERVYVLAVEAGIPISINICKEKSHILLVTDKRKLMMMEGSTFDLSYTFEDVAGLQWNNLHTFFCASLKNHFFKIPVVWNSKGDCVAAAGFEGVHVWKQSGKIQTENGSILKGHIGKVLDLCMKSNMLFSLGSDGMVMYWNYEKVTIELNGNVPDLKSELKKEIKYAVIPVHKQTEPQGQFIQTAFLSTVFESSSFFFSQDHIAKTVLISLDLQYIYGGHFHLRSSLYYVHFHDPDRPTHCSRHLIYYISRYPIVFNPVTQSQSFYTSHKQKITSISLHPYLNLAASADQNLIHIWKIQERIPVSKLVSALQNIFLLRFGNNKQGGELIAVIGQSESLFGLELFNWSREECLAKVVLYMEPQDLQFHPSELFRFALCGVGNFSVWKRSGRVLGCKTEVRLEKVLTVMKYLVFRQRKEVDLLIGTSVGELLISVEGRLIVHIDNAHEGAVLSIDIAEYQGNGLVFTGGQDGYVKIWTHALIPINKFHISCITDPRITPYKLHEISNLQVYICTTTRPLDSTLPKGARTEPLVLALGTSGGALIEVSIMDLSFTEEVTLQYKVHLENHCNGTDRIAKEIFALHPDYPILASITEDKTLKIWEYENHLCLASKELDPGTKPCAIEFSCTGILAIGMDNGVIVILNSREQGWGYQQKGSIELNVVFSVRESNASVLSIVFSKDAEYLAVSYNNFKGVSRFGEKNRIKSGNVDITTGFVALFQSDDDEVYVLSCKIILPFGNIKDIGSYPARGDCAVSKMEFSDDNLYLSLLHQKIKYKDGIPDPNDFKPLLVVWDVLSKRMVEDFTSISNVHWVNTIIQCMLLSAVKPNGINVGSTEFLEESMAFFIGDSAGTVLVSRLSVVAAAYQKKLRNSNSPGVDLLTKSRQYLAHTSSVLWIRQFNQFLFTAAYEENCIFQWLLNYEEPSWELDYSDISIGPDPFSEVLHVEDFNKIFTETWMPQSEFPVKHERSLELTLEASIGRRGRDRRNNLKYDSEDRIVYVTGNNLVMYSKDNTSQIFLQYTSKVVRANLGEISSFCLTADKRMVFIGTSEMECKVSLWDLNASTMLLSFPLIDSCIVLSMHLSPSCRYLACISLSKQYLQVLNLLEVSTDFSVSLIASSVISSNCPYKLKDVCVLEDNSISILTCGVQHFMRWKLHANTLHFYSIELPESIKICLLCIFVYINLIVTAADDGKMYVWHEDKLIRSVPAHDGCILSLEINEELGIAVTGGADGHVIVWKIAVSGAGEEISVHLDSLREYSLQDPTAPNIAYAVQSLSVGNFLPEKGFQVLIGTQSGDVYELSYEVNADLDALVKVSAAIDSQNIQSMACDVTSTIMFTLSASGIFSIWDLQLFAQVYTFDFNNKGIKLCVFHKRQFEETEHGKNTFVVLGFDNQILLIKVMDSNDHEILEDFTFQAKNVTDMHLSANEKYLAVACNNDQKSQVDIYLVQSSSFDLDKNLFGFRGPVVRLDFSTDGYYLMCEDNLGEVLLFELETQNIASFQSVEFEIEWLNEGLRHSSGLKSIHQMHTVGNKIACITKSPGLSTLAVGDEFGIISLYQLPYVPGSLLVQVPGHAYKTSLLMFTRNDEYLISYSQLDRTILKWKVQGEARE